MLNKIAAFRLSDSVVIRFVRPSGLHGGVYVLSLHVVQAAFKVAAGTREADPNLFISAGKLISCCVLYCIRIGTRSDNSDKRQNVREHESTCPKRLLHTSTHSMHTSTHSMDTSTHSIHPQHAQHTSLTHFICPFPFPIAFGCDDATSFKCEKNSTANLLTYHKPYIRK